jgi:hypothetical protein
MYGEMSVLQASSASVMPCAILRRRTLLPSCPICLRVSMEAGNANAAHGDIKWILN